MRLAFEVMAHVAGDDERVKILQRMTPAQKLRAAERLYWSARQLKAAWLRQQHPEWPDERIEREVRDAFLFHRG